MKIRLMIIAASAALLSACGNGGSSNPNSKPPKAELTQQIDSLENVFSGNGENFSRETARAIYKAYSDFIDAFPKDGRAPEYMFKAAGMARGLEKPQKALELYQSLLTDHPGYGKKAETRFLIAFVYDSDLNQREKARQNYKLVAKNYSDSPWSEQAKQRLETLGLTDEQLIKMFEKNRKNQRGDSTASSAAE